MAAIGINGMLYFGVVKKSSTPAAAVCFAVLLLGVVLGFMLPGMHHAIAHYSPVPLEVSVMLPLSLPLTWIVNFLTNINPTAASSSTEVHAEGPSHQNNLLLLPPRLGICIFWILSLVVFLPASEYVCQQYSRYIPQIASRKLFHFLSVAMFTPIMLIDPDMMFLSFSVALCALLLIEYIR